MSPYERLLAVTSHNDLAAFEDAYVDPEYKYGHCERCGSAMASAESRRMHTVWHRIQAEQRWVLAAAILRLARRTDFIGDVT